MDERLNLVFQTQPLKKTISPKWNEQFQLNVWDAEAEVVYVRLMNGAKKFEAKGSKFLGDVSFPLRSAARDFDHPKGKLKWFPLNAGKSGEKVTGECLIYIEFFDTREQHGPKDFKHESHVGWTRDGGFDINNIPAEWKKIFKQVGIRRADLENNPELAGQVLNIMQKAETEDPSVLLAAASPTPAPTPAPTPQMYQAPQPPPQPQPQYHQPAVSQPAPPPPPVASGPSAPRPPAPPPAGGGYSAPAPAVSSPAPPPPPPPAASQDSGLSSGGMSDLEAQLQARAGKLRKVDTPEVGKPAAAPVDSGNPLSNALMAALKQHRKDIEGDDKDAGWDDDGWN
jgi:hypothetical protein